MTETKPIDKVLEERGKTHGKFDEQALTAQTFKHVMSNMPNWHDMPGYMREALELIATKISRMGHGNWKEPDHALDISGYSQLIVAALKNTTS